MSVFLFFGYEKKLNVSAEDEAHHHGVSPDFSCASLI